ncbi:MAG: hypothetical protein WBA97_26530 [Actinophytocola sp.]|uniref:hypothetical protein n=1 Tax=Actinophytocola sp. TaxID=1872138 RepID=UPI003C72EE54
MSGRDDVPFWGLTPHQIYEQLTNGPGSGRLSDASDAASQEWQREEDRAREIRALAADMKSGWDGQAGDAAHGAAGPLAESALVGAVRLHISKELLNRQTEGFHSASNSVVPVPEEPPESTVLNDVIPWETDLDKEIRSYQSDAQHNIDVFGRYDTTSLGHEEPLAREYSTITSAGGEISVRGPGGTSDSDGYSDSGEDGLSGDPEPGEDGSGDGGASGGSPGVGSRVDGHGVPGGTQTSQVSPSTTPGPGVVPHMSQPGPTTSSPVGLVGAGPVVGAAPPGTGGGTGGPVGRGAGPGSGAVGGRGGSAGGGPGVRGGPGAGAGALAAEQAAQRGGLAGASGGRGGAGMSGVPGGAAGRGKGDEDSEHQRKVLIEADPESTFGNELLTAPQVIGDPLYEDNE